MSNYLENLIAKSFNQAEVARPRLASMFEPLLPNASTAFGELRAIETPDFEQVPGDAPSTNPMRENRQDTESKKALPLPTMNQPSEKIEPPVWRGNQQPVTPEQKVAQSFNESKRQPTQQQNAETNDKDALSSGRAFDKDALPHRRALIKREEKSPSRQSLQPLAKMAVPNQIQNESVQIRRPINKQLAEREMKESNLADLSAASEAHKIIVQPRITMPVENQRASGKVHPAFQQPLTQQTETQTPPTINVTIGRIEIRATTPTTQPRKPTPAAQTLSLDEYLRQRNRGGRE